MEKSTKLLVIWTDSIARTVLRLREVQELAGGPARLKVIEGIASDQMETQILAGLFDVDRAARLLSRSLGGSWQVRISVRATPPVLDIIAERMEV
jgi:hypothetical protein